ncbi:MAG: lipoprotein-releasing system permease protein [Candidatus Azotimanducaceae bacterium]
MERLNYKVPLEIALRYSSSRKESGYLSFISKVSLFGMSLGVIVLTIIVSVMNGFDTELKRRILGAVPHVVLVDNANLLNRDELMKHPAVEYVAPFQERQGMVVGRNASKLITVYGVEVSSEAAVSIISDNMTQGTISVLTPSSNAVVIGRALGYQLGLRLGDELAIVIPKPNPGGKSVKPILAKVIVEGFFELESELDYGLILMSLADLQKISKDTRASYRVKLKDIFEAETYSEYFSSRYGPQVEVSNWTELYGDFFETVKMEKIMMFVLLSFVVMIAAFNIVSGLSMMVKDKSSDIAILTTLGLPSSSIMLVFVVQGAVIGFLGILLGLIIGLPIAFYVPEIVSFIEQMIGARMLAGTYFSEVPSDVRVSDIVLIVWVSIIISLMATLYPAYSASRLDPAEVLRRD